MIEAFEACTLGKMATLANVATCVLNLRTKLVAAGFKLPAAIGAAVDNQMWAAVALLTDSATAHKLAGRNLVSKDAAGQMAERIAACDKATVALALRKDLPQLVATQKDIVTPAAEKRAIAARNVNIGLGILTGVMAAAAGLGLYYTLRS